MPTKKELADRAFEKQEDQRALAIVCLAAEGMERTEERARVTEAVARVRERFLTVTPIAKPEPSVPGQLNLLDGSIETCPSCGAPRWQWVALALDFGVVPKLQCGNCAASFEVTFTQYNAIVAERRQQHKHTDTVKSPVIPEKVTRTRGAG